MKVKESIWHEALKADKKADQNSAKDVRKQTLSAQSELAKKSFETKPALKEETKFANILESSVKLQKPDQKRDDASEERRDDQKKEKKKAAGERQNAEHLAENEQTEKRGLFGGQSGFGTGANINQTVLNENFAARSILHIADLERLVSTIRTQTQINGKREIILQLKHSIMEGLQVKILTDPAARVQIEFLAANENVRSQIEKHSTELAAILRGRGIDLEEIKMSILPDKNTNFENSQLKPK